MNKDMENYVFKCEICQENGPRKTETSLFPLLTSTDPWERIHIDFTGKVDDYFWLIIIDSYSKWFELYKITSCTTENTIGCLEDSFSRRGIPISIVSDNWAKFCSKIFEDLCKK